MTLLSTPRTFRCTLSSIPQTQALLNKARLPLGLLLHPFRDLQVRPDLDLVPPRASRSHRGDPTHYTEDWVQTLDTLLTPGGNSSSSILYLTRWKFIEVKISFTRMTWPRGSYSECSDEKCNVRIEHKVNMNTSRYNIDKCIQICITSKQGIKYDSPESKKERKCAPARVCQSKSNCCSAL